MKRSLIRHCQSRASLHGKLRSLLSEGKVEEVDISKYTTDWTNLYHGGSIVVKPSTTEDVVKTINFCRQEKMSIVPQGGNTGLVGGQVGFKNEVIMSMEKMNKILSIDTISAIAVVEAGCILEVLNKETEKVGFILPLDLGAKGSCQIGGNVATNAGGLRLLRYGSLHQNIVGLEVVKADGSVLNMLRTLHKDNCGYHLKNMFVGSEGTLGVITKVAIQLRPLPTSIQVSIVKLSSYLSLPTLISRVRNNLSDIVSALEFIDSPSVRAVQVDAPNITSKLSSSSLLPTESNTPECSGNSNHPEGEHGIPGEVLVLLECSGCHQEHDRQRIEELLGQLMEEGIVVDAMIAQDHTQVQNAWALRENVPVSLMHLSRKPNSFNSNASTDKAQTQVTGRLYKYDVSLSVAEWPLLVQDLKRNCSLFGYPFFNISSVAPLSTSPRKLNDSALLTKLQKSENLIQKYKDAARIEVCCFGHVGDQNLHLNILLTWNESKFPESACAVEIEEYKSILKVLIDHFVFTDVIARNGSVSAEHGLGQQKAHLLTQARSAEEVSMMVGLKKLMDPLNILNPGKVIPLDLLK